MSQGLPSVRLNLQSGLDWWRIGHMSPLQQGQVAGAALKESASAGK
jgi:hypothetical protein